MNTSFASLALSLLEQPCVGVRGALVGAVGALLPVKVYRGIAWVPVVRRRGAVLVFEALQTGGRLDERAIYGEMLVG